MTIPTPRVRLPAKAKAGEVIEVRTLISHEMETGLRRDEAGLPVPRRIINKFVATFNGAEVFSADWFPAISANPYQAFFVKVPETGTFEFAWNDDNGSVYRASHKIVVD